MAYPKQRNRWECLAVATAIVMNIPVDYIIKMIGHDGSEIINKNRDPLNRRGIHMQEVISLAFDMGYRPVRLEYLPSSRHGQHIYMLPSQQNKIDTIIASGGRGILETQHIYGMGHAFAVIDSKIINPTTGDVAILTDFDLLSYIDFGPIPDFKIKT